MCAWWVDIAACERHIRAEGAETGLNFLLASSRCTLGILDMPKRLTIKMATFAPCFAHASALAWHQSGPRPLWHASDPRGGYNHPLLWFSIPLPLQIGCRDHSFRVRQTNRIFNML